MLHTLVDYPDRATTRLIMDLNRREALDAREMAPPAQAMAQDTVFVARREVLRLTLSDAVADYIAALVDATRRPAAYSEELAGWLRWGASPRAAIAIERGARSLAWLDGRDYVSPEDVQAIVPDALRHRLLLDYTAQARGVTAQACIDALLRLVPAP
jgi:MoxR-like ATPase